MNIDFELHLSPFSTRRICSRDAKRKQEFSNVIGCRSSELFRQPITLLNSCFRFASREQIRLVENGLYARLVTLARGLRPERRFAPLARELRTSDSALFF